MTYINICVALEEAVWRVCRHRQSIRRPWYRGLDTDAVWGPATHPCEQTEGSRSLLRPSGQLIHQYLPTTHQLAKSCQKIVGACPFILINGEWRLSKLGNNRGMWQVMTYRSHLLSFQPFIFSRNIPSPRLCAWMSRPFLWTGVEQSSWRRDGAFKYWVGVRTERIWSVTSTGIQALCHWPSFENQDPWGPSGPGK